MKRFLQDCIQDFVELFGRKSWSKTCSAYPRPLVSSKSVHPHGLVAGTSVDSSPKEMLGLYVIPAHGLQATERWGTFVHFLVRFCFHRGRSRVTLYLVPVTFLDDFDVMQRPAEGESCGSYIG